MCGAFNVRNNFWKLNKTPPLGRVAIWKLTPSPTLSFSLFFASPFHDDHEIESMREMSVLIALLTLVASLTPRLVDGYVNKIGP